MDSAPILARIAEVLNRHRREAVMVGNAAAAIQGAPITTVDIDFMFRRTPLNLKKLKAVALELRATILRPYYPVSPLFRMQRESDQLQIDFMPQISGIRSYERLRDRATKVTFAGSPLYIASLADIIKSKKAAGRPRDLAALPVLVEALEALSANTETDPRRPQKRK